MGDVNSFFKVVVRYAIAAVGYGGGEKGEGGGYFSYCEGSFTSDYDRSRASSAGMLISKEEA